MYTVGYYNDEDFRAFYSGQDAANIDDFFTDNGEYLMVYLPEVTDREFLAASATVMAVTLSARADTPLTRRKRPSATCTRSPCSPPAYARSPVLGRPGVFCCTQTPQHVVMWLNGVQTTANMR